MPEGNSATFMHENPCNILNQGIEGDEEEVKEKWKSKHCKHQKLEVKICNANGAKVATLEVEIEKYKAKEAEERSWQQKQSCVKNTIKIASKNMMQKHAKENNKSEK